jgi:chaperonin GroES
MNLKVVGARCIIKEVKAEEKTKGGIILSAKTIEPTFTGTVLAVGDGAYLENGSIKPMTVKVGDTVMYAKFAGTPIKYNDEEFIVLNERDILVIVTDDVEEKESK